MAMTPTERYRAVLTILSNDWDPIGISGIDAAQAEDEYRNYAAQVSHVISSGGGREELREFLWLLWGRICSHPEYPSDEVVEKLLALR